LLMAALENALTTERTDLKPALVGARHGQELGRLSHGTEAEITIVRERGEVPRLLAMWPRAMARARRPHLPPQLIEACVRGPKGYRCLPAQHRRVRHVCGAAILAAFSRVW